MIPSSSELSTDDNALLAASRSGDVTAFGQLIERHHALVCAVAYSRTGDRVVSEDIAQDTFLAAWRSLATLRDASRLRPWLCGIARNLAGKTNRSRRRETLVDSDTLAQRRDSEPGALQILVTRETEAAVWTALSALPEVYREPLVLFYREDQSVKEVALGLGLSEDTAKQRLSRGRKALEERLGELVGQTVAAGRPSRAARAAVVASIVAAAAAMPGTATAATAAQGASSTSVGWGKLAAGLGVVATVAGLVIWLVVSRGSSEDQAVRLRTAATTTAAPGAQAAVLARLRAAHATWRASARTEAPCDLHGSVRRPDGSAVPGALVGVLEHSWHPGSLEPALIETDAGGAWSATVPRAAAYTISVSAPGHRAHSRRITCSDARATGRPPAETFVLADDGDALHGVLTDIGGGPIAGATLWILDALAPGSATLFIARSDPAGRYELKLAPGPYTVLVIHPDYTFDARPVSLRGTSAREDFTLIPGASIEGTVRDLAGRPVPGAVVSSLAPAPDTEAPLRWKVSSIYSTLLPVTANATGTFRIRSLAPGTLRLTARSGAAAVAEPTSIDLTLAEARSDVALTVRPAHTLAGFVAGGDDVQSGVANVELLAFREDAPIATPLRATTDGAGRFELRGLLPGTYRLAANGAPYAPFVSDPITITDRDRDDALVVLARGVAVRGRIEPPGPATILVEPAGSDRTLTRTLTAAMLRANVADDGTFTLPSVPAGEYLVRARTHALEGTAPVQVAAGSEAAVALTLSPRSAILGLVVDDTGAPLARAIVVADAAGPGEPATARTDDQGRFAIVGLAAGRAQLRVFDARGQRPWAGRARRPFAARKVVVPASGSITERLEVASGGARIEGVAVGPDRKPLADCWIEVRADGAHRPPPFHQPAPVLTDAAGRFVIEGVFGPELTVEASGPDGRLRAIAAHVTAGARLRLELQPPSTLVATVRYHGADVTDATVVLRQPSTGWVRRLTTPSPIRIPMVLAGDYELTVTSPTAYARRTVTVGSAATTRAEVAVDIVLAPWAAVRGTLHGRDGKPWAGATVDVDDLLVRRPLETAADGRFAVDRLAGGAQTLQFFGNGGEMLSFDLELVPGRSLDLGVITARSAFDHQSMATASKDLGLEFSVEAGTLRIANVDPSGPAARAGLRRGDIVRAVGTLTVDDAAAAMSSLTTRWRSRGRDVVWKITRGGVELELAVHVPL